MPGQFLRIGGIWRALAVAVMGVLALSGCARYTAGTSFTCPRAAFVGGTERLTRFEPGAARTPDSIAAEVQLADLLSSCRVNPRTAIANVGFSLLAVRRSTGTAGTLDVPFYVAVADAQGNLIAKQNFTTRLSFPAGQAGVTGVEKIEQTLPLAAGQRAVGFEILVGLQLTPEEFEYNLALR